MSMHVAHILNFSMVRVLISTKRTQAKGADCLLRTGTCLSLASTGFEIDGSAINRCDFSCHMTLRNI